MTRRISAPPGSCFREQPALLHRAARPSRGLVNAIERDEMTELTNGMLVRHDLLGLGKIVALEPKTVHVFFAASKDRFATKLSLLVAGPLLRPAGAGENAWLAGVSAFSLDAKTGRYGVAPTWLSPEEAVAHFL